MIEAIGYFLGRAVIGPLLLSLGVLWIASKLTKKNTLTTKWVVIVAIIILILSMLGNYVYA